MKMVDFTKEGLIIKALMESPLRYKELKKVTGLSHAWLSKKLQELLNVGVIVSRNSYYRLDVERLQEALRNEKTHIARMMAQEIAVSRDVVAVVLFGSLVRSRRKEADIDLLVVTVDNGFSPIQVSLEMFRKFGVAVDILHVTLTEFLKWLYDKPVILFGILSGYEILYDEGYIKPFLKTLKRETLKDWAYVQEKEIWVKKRLLPHISKLQQN
ncbi:MAG: nucleotidyltransferase domain-containing protein, partial [Candidatus Bathyarchaeia archaeon]